MKMSRKLQIVVYKCESYKLESSDLVCWTIANSNFVETCILYNFIHSVDWMMVSEFDIQLIKQFLVSILSRPKTNLHLAPPRHVLA